MSRNGTLLGVVALVSAIAAGASVTTLSAQGRGHGRDAGRKAGRAEHREDKKAKASKQEARKDAAIDRDAHVRAIREYARGGSLPPGLAKRRPLPPGLRKQLRERGELPPGLQKRLVPVPPPLAARLPPAPPYYDRYFAGDDLIIVDNRTHRIAAIIRDVWR